VKIRPVGTELLHVDRQTDMTKLIVAFRNFAKAPNTEFLSHIKLPLYSKYMHVLQQKNPTGL